jgi:putative transposase
MYEWRKMTQGERRVILLARKLNKKPWHSPPHIDIDARVFYIVSAACYEHRHVIGQSIKRMLHIQKALIQICEDMKIGLSAWCVLPNHYHMLVETEDISGLLKCLGKMHGWTARQWNIEDNCAGRKIWCGCAERAIRSDRHFWVSVNYIHNNPVKHGYTRKWKDWEYSSARQYLKTMGREKALEVWKEYPVLEYGAVWDV